MSILVNWLSCDANGHVQITENGYVTGPTEKFWNDVDKLLEIAEEYHIYHGRVYLL